MIQFVANVTSFFRIGEDAVQVGIVRFAFNTEVFSTLGEFPVKSGLIQKIRSIPRDQSLGRDTNIADGLRMATSELQSNRSRSIAKKAIILITDGVANEGGDPAPIARIARNGGIQIFSFGIGAMIDIAQLNNISNQPTSTHVFIAQTFDLSELSQFVSSLAQGVCRSEFCCCIYCIHATNRPFPLTPKYAWNVD